jgi:hypothetical protein
MAPMVPAQGCVSGPPLNRWLARAHCKNQLSVHGQLAGISKLNPRRPGASLSRSFFPDCIVGCAKPGSHAVRSPEKACDVLEASRGSICTNDGHGAGSPGAARGRVLLSKLIVKTCPQITVNWPVSASSILADPAPPFFSTSLF